MRSSNLPISIAVALCIAGMTLGCGANAVQTASRMDVEQCRYLGTIRAVSGIQGMAASTGADDAKYDATEQARVRGATHIVWTQVHGGYAPSAAGDAYRCLRR